jgi:hypothetical protein
MEGLPETSPDVASGQSRHAGAMARRVLSLAIFLLLGTVLVGGCRAKQTVDLTPPATQASRPPDPDLNATVEPPVGWMTQPDRSDARSFHRTWISPTGDTAFGVVSFRMPLPVGHDLAMRYGFLKEMKRETGEATLIDSRWDAARGALRFVVEGGLYRVRVDFFVKGMRGWAFYAGTLRERATNEVELLQAEQARDASTPAVR